MLFQFQLINEKMNLKTGIKLFVIKPEYRDLIIEYWAKSPNNQPVQYYYYQTLQYFASYSTLLLKKLKLA